MGVAKTLKRPKGRAPGVVQAAPMLEKEKRAAG